MFRDNIGIAMSISISVFQCVLPPFLPGTPAVPPMPAAASAAMRAAMSVCSWILWYAVFSFGFQCIILPYAMLFRIKLHYRDPIRVRGVWKYVCMCAYVQLHVCEHLLQACFIYVYTCFLRCAIKSLTIDSRRGFASLNLCNLLNPRRPAARICDTNVRTYIHIQIHLGKSGDVLHIHLSFAAVVSCWMSGIA